MADSNTAELNEQLQHFRSLLRQLTGIPEMGVTTKNRTHCPESQQNDPPENRVYTQNRVRALREVMTNIDYTGGIKLDAYIVTHHDEHMSPSLNERDERIKFISGMSGTNGWAVVTESAASLWTDGRYFLQAEQEMDCDWILMKIGESGYPTTADWLVDVIPSGGAVGAYPPQARTDEWQNWESVLATGNISLVPVQRDLIDYIWLHNRPKSSSSPLFIHQLQFAGEGWFSKVRRVRKEMTTEWADILVITALDEVAFGNPKLQGIKFQSHAKGFYKRGSGVEAGRNNVTYFAEANHSCQGLLNLRGNDRPTSPLFDAYMIVTMDEIRLYLKNHTVALSNQSLVQHLNTTEEGQCANQSYPCVIVKDKSEVFSDIRSLSRSGEGYRRVWLSPDSNYAVYTVAGEDRLVKRSPIQLMKSIKNKVERKRYAECQIRDSAAVVEFASFLEEEVKSGRKKWTEISAEQKLNQVRSTYDYFWGKSFPAVSAVGAHAAIIHYHPTPTTDSTLTTDHVYLLDSGGQYLDGTTDVTRTFMFGEPSDIIKEVYTRVLMGVIDLATTVWPEGKYGDDLDVRTRNILWQNGWDYKHGTGHGIGYFLNVHEGPASIGKRGGPKPLYEGMFFSDEPGFYVDGDFGIRLETIMEVVKAETPHKFGGVNYLTFHPVTLVPFEPHMINYQLLQPNHRQWLNTYHNRCEHEVGPLLMKAEKLKAYEWLISRTRPIPDHPVYEFYTAKANQTLSFYTTTVLTLLMSVGSLIMAHIYC